MDIFNGSKPPFLKYIPNASTVSASKTEVDYAPFKQSIGAGYCSTATITTAELNTYPSSNIVGSPNFTTILEYESPVDFLAIFGSSGRFVEVDANITGQGANDGFRLKMSAGGIIIFDLLAKIVTPGTATISNFITLYGPGYPVMMQSPFKLELAQQRSVIWGAGTTVQINNHYFLGAK